MNIEKAAIKDLMLDPSNVRKHSDKNLMAIKGSLAKFGQQKAIVVGEHNIVLAGNGTLEAAKALGWEEILIVRTDLKGSDAVAYALADNRTTDLSEWDEEGLRITLQSLYDEDYNLVDIGFDVADYGIGNTEGLTADDEIPELTENIYGVQLGDIWQLGSHRLMCGDTTIKSNVEKLLAGEKADMVFTDPPYGLGGYKGRGEETQREVSGDTEDPTKFYQSIPDAPEVYVWGGFKNLKHIDFEPDDVIVWRKNNFGMGRGYRGQYEICMYTGSFDGSDSDVWDVPKDSDYKHPTQKPVALCERAIKNSNPRLVVDIYLGSGSTIIACEKTGRKCYGMEIDPHYCSIIIERWQNFSGKKAEKISGP